MDAEDDGAVGAHLMSGAGAYVLRGRLRADWRSLLLTAVLAGLSFGVGLAMLTSAHRAAGAHDRYFDDVQAYDYSTGFPPELVGGPMDDVVAGVPGLAAYEQVVGFVMQVEGVDPTEIPFQLGPLDPDASLERPTVLAGRLATEANEVVINAEAARRSGLRAGDRVTAHLRAFDPATSEFVLDPADVPLVVTGVVRMPDEFLLDPFREAGLLIPSAAFAQAHLDSRVYGNLWMRLRPGSDGAELRDALGSVGLAFDEDRTQERDRVWESVRPLVAVAALAGGLVVLVTAVLLAQSQVRAAAARREDELVLSTLGCTSATRRAVRLAQGALLAGGIALVGLAATLFGTATIALGPYAEVDPAQGMRADPLVLAPGLLVVVVTIGVIAAIGTPASGRHRPAPSAIPLPSLPLPLRLGVSWSFDPRRRGARSLLAALPGLVTALTLVVAAIVFVGSLQALGERPTWYGAPWEVVGRVPFGLIEQSSVDAVAADRDVEGFAIVGVEGGLLDGRPAPLLEITPGRGPLQWPVVLDGREPSRPGEVLVGGSTLHRLGLEIGDRATVQGQQALEEEAGPPPSFEAHIVGTAVFPNIGSRGVDGPRLSTGVAIRRADLPGTEVDTGTMLLVDLRDGVDPAAWSAGRPLVSEGSGFSADWLLDLEPVEVEQAEAGLGVIWWTVAALGAAAVAMMSHGLASSVRGRSRDYAVLRSLGMSGRQLAGTVATQGLAALSIAAALALVLGVALGRTTWLSFARSLGVVPRATVPTGSLIAALVAALVLTALALVPWARRVRRAPAADLLRSDGAGPGR